MEIDLDEAIRIHARVSRARYGRSAKQRALKTAQHLRRKGDEAGAAVWERLAAEIEQTRSERHLSIINASGGRA